MGLFWSRGGSLDRVANSHTGTLDEDQSLNYESGIKMTDPELNKSGQSYPDPHQV
jgi:hypothetical protein